MGKYVSRGKYGCWECTSIFLWSSTDKYTFVFSSRILQRLQTLPERQIVFGLANMGPVAYIHKNILSILVLNISQMSRMSREKGVKRLTPPINDDEPGEEDQDASQEIMLKAKKYVTFVSGILL